MNCPDGFWCLQFKDWLNAAILVVTVIAIVYGPIVAVRLTQHGEEERERIRRKYQTFYNLMKTRRVTLSGDHVSALNVIQTEFHDDEKVIDAYKKYIDNLAGPSLPEGSNEDAIRRHIEARDDVFNEFMFELGRHLGFTFDKRDLAKYSYAPQGWANLENEQAALRRLSIELLLGQRGLPIAPFQPSPSASKYPPAPPVSNQPAKQ